MESVTHSVLPYPGGHGTVVHLTGRMTDLVFGFLGPATATLAASGVKQVVVLTDAPEFRHLLPRFDESVELVLAPAERHPWRRWQQLASAFAHAIRRDDLRAVHLHGVLPLAVALPLLRGRVPLYFSPHGSKSLGALRVLSRPLLWAARIGVAPSAQRAIASVSAEAPALNAVGREIAVVETPVEDVFFKAERRESRQPLVVTSGRIEDPRRAELVVQMAVLLGGEDLRLSFNWIGPVDAVSAARLATARVGVFPVTQPDERALRLSSGWVYVAHGRSRGFPLHLAEAMAAGLPCVAIDSPMHRSLLRHGETGFLCENDDDVLRHVAELVDNRVLRRTMGRAARREAERRFAQERFRDELLAAYDVAHLGQAAEAEEASSAPVSGFPSTVTG
jgi:glycosyltransferase involved in cell wall biosynthesis